MMKTVSGSPDVPTMPKLSLKGLLLGGGMVLVAGFGSMGAWAALAPLHSAVIAPGVLVPETGRKTVRHAEGGTISQLLVKEGDRIRAGDVLVRLDATEAAARLDILTAEWLTQLALSARLEAEVVDRDDIAWPDELSGYREDPKVARLITNQGELFHVRRVQLRQEIEILQERVLHLESEAVNLTEQRRFTGAELGLLREELGGTRRLLENGNATRNKMLELQKEEARLQSRDRELAARISQSRQQAAEARSEIAQRRDERREKSLTELTTARAEISKLVEQRRDAANRLATREIKAPEDGLVVGLRHLSAGVVIAPNEAIFDVVPGEQALIVEARVRPQDIEAVHPGMDTKLTLSAYDTRIIGTLPGRVEHVSADRLIDQATQQPYYNVRVSLVGATPHEVGSLRIIPGMPVEAQILVSPRTPLDYLISPIVTSYNRAFVQK
ncbi:HlyD family type I secretion periplasmic adaptor subunit [Arenibaculum pallidiluteum]|uniref:HlyD family type I secretion periplasmic adaptor subunit n=1 Tax=Arenibaculum pallidiluteum TaxID=2812559 RepID=UPI001A95BA37|nr:HlyD family type I secretion periplasmic adaptor subunit [Arenibaculum pallidiluteum]